MDAEELKSKCIEDLRAEFKKAIEERDEARLKQKCLKTMFDEAKEQRDLLEMAARDTVLWLTAEVLPNAQEAAPVEYHINELQNAANRCHS